MKRILALIGCLFGFSCGSQTLTPSRFTEEFANAVTAASPSIKVAIKSDLRLEFTAPTGAVFTAFLDNAYKEYVGDPKRVREVIDRYSSGLLESHGLGEKIDRTRIVPVIKDRHWPAEIARSVEDRGSEHSETVFEDLNRNL